MTLLHHAVNGNGDERALAASTGAPPATGGERLPPVTEGGAAAETPIATEPPHMFSLDQRLPVIQSVLEFARTKLWMPEVRMPVHTHEHLDAHGIDVTATSASLTLWDLLTGGFGSCFSRHLVPSVEAPLCIFRQRSWRGLD